MTVEQQFGSPAEYADALTAFLEASTNLIRSPSMGGWITALGISRAASPCRAEATASSVAANTTSPS